MQPAKSNTFSPIEPMSIRAGCKQTTLWLLGIMYHAKLGIRKFAALERLEIHEP